MSSIVLELQKSAMDPNIKISDLLRQAYLVAKELEIEEFKSWINKEMDGYGEKDELPTYRIVHGEPKYYNPFYGYQDFIIDHEGLMDAVSTRYLRQPISELEDLYKNDNKFICLINPSSMKILRDTLGIEENIKVFVPTSQLKSAFDSVRNEILKWISELEEKDPNSSIEKSLPDQGVNNNNSTNSSCEELLKKLMILILEIKGVSSYFPFSSEFKKDYNIKYESIEKWIKKLNIECSLNFKHNNFITSSDSSILNQMSRNDLKEYLDDCYHPLEKEILKHLEFGNDPFWDIIHPEIFKVAKNKFEDGYHADAVLSSFKELNLIVKNMVKKSTGEELDGKSLMFKAFNEKTPIIILSDLSTESGRNIQEGYKFIFGGAMQAIRNPKAHENQNIGKKEAIHSIYLASKLMYRLDNKKNSK